MQVSPPKSHETPLLPGDDTYRVRVPSKPVNNEMLGNIISKLINQMHPHVSEDVVLEYPKYLPIKLCLLGKTYSGKEPVSSYIQTRFNLEAISIEEIISHAISKYGNCDDSFEDVDDDPRASLYPNHGSELLEKNHSGKKLLEAQEEELLSKRLSQENIGDESMEEYNKDLNDGAGQDRLFPSPPILSEKFNDLDDDLGQNNFAGGQQANQKGKSTDSGRKPEERLVRKRSAIKSLIRCVFRGEEPSDELYCEVIMDKIKSLFPLISEEEFLQQMKDRKR
jgi:hypothetical protein